jgi:hypothetical protein
LLGIDTLDEEERKRLAEHASGKSEVDPELIEAFKAMLSGEGDEEDDDDEEKEPDPMALLNLLKGEE